MTTRRKDGVGMVDVVGYTDPQQSVAMPEVALGIRALPAPSSATTYRQKLS